MTPVTPAKAGVQLWIVQHVAKKAGIPAYTPG